MEAIAATCTTHVNANEHSCANGNAVIAGRFEALTKRTAPNPSTVHGPIVHDDVSVSIDFTT